MTSVDFEVSEPNDCGVHIGRSELLARRGRSYAAINIALGPDGLCRFGIDLMYSYGGFGFAAGIGDDGFKTVADARYAGMAQLLRRWPRPFPSDPASVVQELTDLREQIEAQLRQPSLF